MMLRGKRAASPGSNRILRGLAPGALVSVGLPALFPCGVAVRLGLLRDFVVVGVADISAG